MHKQLTALACALSIMSCAPPCVPFSRAAHEVACGDGGVLVATLFAGNDTVLGSKCSVTLDAGVPVAVMTGVVCPGEQLERLASRVESPCEVPVVPDGELMMSDAVSLHTDGGVTRCAAR